MKKFIILFIILYVSTLSAQNLNAGFDIEFHQVRVSNQFDEVGILGGEGLPLDFHIYAGYKPIEKLNLIVRGGNNLHTDFKGWEYGIKGTYIIYSPFFISAGFLQHMNELNLGSNSWEVEEASIFMLHTGVGINLSSSIL